MYKSRITKTTLALTCALAVGVSAQAEAGMSVPSEVSFRQSMNSGQKFKGRVSSPADDCVVGRKVLVYRAQPGSDQKVDKTFASESGRFRVIIPMQAGNKLYAVIPVDRTPLGTKCQNDRSDKVTVN